MGRAGGGDVQLAYAGVAESDHADLAVEHPGLTGHGLDDVVPVSRLCRAEDVEDAA